MAQANRLMAGGQSVGRFDRRSGLSTHRHGFGILAVGQKNDPPYKAYMDLYNNKHGRSLRNDPNGGDTILSDLQNGDLLYPPPDGSGGTNPDGSPAPICN